MTYKGIAFRQTADYATDATDDTYWIEGQQYPQSRKGLTFGATDDVSMEARNRWPSSPLGGTAWSLNTGNRFKVDLPNGAGTYNVKLALGDLDYASSAEIVIKDGTGSAVITITDASVAAGSFVDATGTEYTGANWLTSNTPVQVTFSDTFLTIAWTTAYARIAYIALESVGGGGSSSVSLTGGLTQGILTKGRLIA